MTDVCLLQAGNAADEHGWRCEWIRPKRYQKKIAWLQNLTKRRLKRCRELKKIYWLLRSLLHAPMNRVNKLIESGLEAIKLFSCSSQLSTKFILLINVKMPTIVGILTFIYKINTPSESLKARKVFIFQHFSFMSS